MDLSNATDRFPIEGLKILLKGHFCETQIDAWEQIMVGYPFQLGNTPGQGMKYSVGNPMGFYSS
jgi:hypothetical protein